VFDEVLERDYLLKIDEAVRAAERKIALADCPDEETDPEGYWDAYEAIFHCETCTVREIMEVIWPSVETYIEWLRGQIVIGA
jgi:hypothetical protein